MINEFPDFNVFTLYIIFEILLAIPVMAIFSKNSENHINGQNK